jgi:hypothetical protein
VNITGGERCGVADSNVAGNGNVGVAMLGGDRQVGRPPQASCLASAYGIIEQVRTRTVAAWRRP